MKKLVINNNQFQKIYRKQNHEFEFHPSISNDKSNIMIDSDGYCFIIKIVVPETIKINKPIELKYFLINFDMIGIFYR